MIINNRENCNFMCAQGEVTVQPCDICADINITIDYPLPPTVRCEINMDLIFLIIFLLIILKRGCFG